MKRKLLITLSVCAWVVVAGCVLAAVLSIVAGDVTSGALDIVMAGIYASAVIGIEIPARQLSVGAAIGESDHE